MTSVRILLAINFSDHVLEYETSLAGDSWGIVTNTVATTGDHAFVIEQPPPETPDRLPQSLTNYPNCPICPARRRFAAAPWLGITFCNTTLPQYVRGEPVPSVLGY